MTTKEILSELRQHGLTRPPGRMHESVAATWSLVQMRDAEHDPNALLIPPKEIRNAKERALTDNVLTNVHANLDVKPINGKWVVVKGTRIMILEGTCIVAEIPPGVNKVNNRGKKERMLRGKSLGKGLLEAREKLTPAHRILVVRTTRARNGSYQHNIAMYDAASL
ncbi:hypothetical protein FJZ48_03935 [Candidatus Uhrbacteria bacterium]|nr:hypothetical protein [Candidatus Uhrbacteria bacterium]